jgi:glucose/arabinose dehydrogenase
MHIFRRLAVAAALTAALGALPIAAQAAPGARDGAGFKLVTVAKGFTQPTYVTQPAGDSRIFVVEQRGVIRTVENGQVLSKPFADLSADVTAGGEQGLLSVAFHPDFAKNGRLFVYYTAKNGHEQVWELRAKPGAESITGFRRLLLDMADPYSNHNGGDLQFGPDGDLYIGTGDGGSEGDPEKRPQNLQSPLGKMLRIDVDRHPSGRPYAIPAGNPFATGGKGLAILYAWGLRNPWRYSFDRSTGDLWIGDVGQDHYEEVDHVAKGKAVGGNFGWSRFEGTHVYDANRQLTGGGHTIFPVVEYPHTLGCSITGGYVYRGPTIPALEGRYVYTDYCSARLWTIAPGSKKARDVSSVAKSAGLSSPSSFGEGADGTLYVVSQGGTLYRFARA